MEKEDEMFSIWSLVGVILLVYGVIITGCGVYYIINGLPPTVAGESNPSLWWGIIIFVFGIVFSIIGKKRLG